MVSDRSCEGNGRSGGAMSLSKFCWVRGYVSQKFQPPILLDKLSRLSASGAIDGRTGSR